MPKNLLNSGVDCPVEPSAIFNAIESQLFLFVATKHILLFLEKKMLAHLFLHLYQMPFAKPLALQT
jgi:hypothetical protein